MDFMVHNVNIMHTYWILLLTALGGLVSSETIGSQTCDRYAVIDSVFYCYVIKNDYVTYNMAAADCAAIGGSLPVITSLEVNDILLPIVERIRLMWLSLVQYTAAWRWMDSRYEVYEQGCYMRNEKDFNTSVTLKNMTQDICVTYCRSQGAWYAALRNRSECYCSSTFHIKETEPSNTMPCNLPCPGNYSQDCGSQHSAILVLNVYGTASHWGGDQPNEHLAYQSCGLADSEHDYRWNDVKCKENHGALCAIEAPPGDDLENSTFCMNSTYNSLLIDRTCYVFFVEKTSWFLAHTKCIKNGGRLFTSTEHQGADVWDTLRQYMDTHFHNYGATLGSINFWIGLVKRDWRWDKERPLLYSNWDTDSPSSNKQNCSAMNERGKWEDAECSRNYRYICQLGVWIILAGAILVILIMVIITVAYCRHCQRVKKERKKFTLYYGIDVGSQSKYSDNEDKLKSESNSRTPSYLDPLSLPPSTVSRGLDNGGRDNGGLDNGGLDNGGPDTGKDNFDPQYGYTCTIESTKPGKRKHRI